MYQFRSVYNYVNTVNRKHEECINLGVSTTVQINLFMVGFHLTGQACRSHLLALLSTIQIQNCNIMMVSYLHCSNFTLSEVIWPLQIKFTIPLYRVAPNLWGIVRACPGRTWSTLHQANHLSYWSLYSRYTRHYLLYTLDLLDTSYCIH